MNTSWTEWLKAKGACISDYKEASRFSSQGWWNQATRPDWMLWVLRKQAATEKEVYVRIALFCAKLAYEIKPSPTSLVCIDAVEAYLLDPTAENQAKCRRAAYAADAADAADAAYAAYAADAAADAADAAADAAAYAAADAAAYAAAKVKICNEIRRLIPELSI